MTQILTALFVPVLLFCLCLSMDRTLEAERVYLIRSRDNRKVNKQG